MLECRSCAYAMPEGSRYCASCGSALVSGSLADTITSGPRGVPTSSSPDEGRFAAGAVVAGRYRILNLAGRGGMGEVYRAYDSKLEQAVALKFLPEALAQDGAALARFHNEVRIARQVSHANVCRVYDIGEWDGAPFLSMEYVDGEDLASLLRRIGRLSPDKALEIARRLCAALAAAHEKGVLHRDLKPGNIMINSRGQVLITDFGLAALAAQISAAEARHGTPAYMAPEQLAGKEVSIRSDIYALGLVLYEMFTGRRAFEAQTRDELLRLEEESSPASPSTMVRDLDPAVERVILHCLEADPARRPNSALSVAAALPGGDPLAAALAAGETPSPEMVAACSETTTISVGLALALLLATLMGIAAVAAWHNKADMLGIVPMEKPPDVLRERARDLLHGFGYTEPFAASYAGFHQDSDYVDWAEQHDSTPDRWTRLHTYQPPVIHFWYRESPQPMAADVSFAGSTIELAPARTVSAVNPPLYIPGMLRIETDPRGRLFLFEAVPPEMESPARGAPDWSALFTAAGLDPGAFSPAEPSRTPPTPFDAQAAWLGAYPGMPGNSLRLEAAAWRGRFTYFRIYGPWTQPLRSNPPLRATDIIYASMILITWTVGALLAHRNTRLGRGDRRGTFRLAAFVFVVWMLLWLAGSDHLTNLDELRSLLTGASASLLWSGVLWVLYIALEPYVRRRWPQAIIGWSRVLAGHWRDPLVGSELLVGTAAGAGMALLHLGRQFVREQLGAPPQFTTTIYTLSGLRSSFCALLAHLAVSIITALIILFLIFLFRVIARSEWGAAVLFCLLSAALDNAGVTHAAIGVVFSVAGALIAVYVLIRYGLVALATALYVSAVLTGFPLMLDFSKWYAGTVLFALAVVLALALFGFREALAGRTLLREEVFAR